MALNNTVRTKILHSGEIAAFSEGAMRHNNAVVEYYRTSACVLSGCLAGILGLTGFLGFGFYLLSLFGLWIMILMKTGSKWNKYFVNRIYLLTNGLFGGLFTYVLFWTDRIWIKVLSKPVFCNVEISSYFLCWWYKWEKWNNWCTMSNLFMVWFTFIKHHGVKNKLVL